MSASEEPDVCGICREPLNNGKPIEVLHSSNASSSTAPAISHQFHRECLARWANTVMRSDAQRAATEGHPPVTIDTFTMVTCPICSTPFPVSPTLKAEMRRLLALRTHIFPSPTNEDPDRPALVITWNGRNTIIPHPPLLPAAAATAVSVIITQSMWEALMIANEGFGRAMQGIALLQNPDGPLPLLNAPTYHSADFHAAHLPQFRAYLLQRFTNNALQHNNDYIFYAHIFGFLMVVNLILIIFFCGRALQAIEGRRRGGGGNSDNINELCINGECVIIPEEMTDMVNIAMATLTEFTKNYPKKLNILKKGGRKTHKKSNIVKKRVKKTRKN